MADIAEDYIEAIDKKVAKNEKIFIHYLTLQK